MAGIFNPFAPPAPPKEKVPSYEEAMAVQEKARRKDAAERCNVTLDGRSHALRFDNILLSDLRELLGKLVKDVQESSPANRDGLRRAGLFLSASRDPDVSAVHLETPSGIIHVCDVPLDQGETKVYQRLAYALSTLPIKNILAAHKAVIITRG